MADSDGAAIALLKRAVELDSAKRYTESLVHYKEGLQLLLEYIKVKFQKHFLSITQSLVHPRQGEEG